MVLFAKFGVDGAARGPEAGPPGRKGLLRRPDLGARPIGTVLPPGSIVAGYEVESVVGSGGIGILYRARQVRLDRPVALKLVEPEVAHDPVVRERLRREARTVAALDHPNIVPLYEAGRGGRNRLHRHPLGRGHRAGHPDPARRPDRAGAGGADGRADRLGAGGGPREGADPPGREALERDRHLRGPRLPHGLRPDEASRLGVGAHGGGADAGDHRLRGARSRSRATRPTRAATSTGSPACSSRCSPARPHTRARRAGWPRCGPTSTPSRRRRARQRPEVPRALDDLILRSLAKAPEHPPLGGGIRGGGARGRGRAALGA